MKLLLKSLLRLRKRGWVLFGHGLTNNRTDDYIEALHTNFERFKKIVESFEELDFEFISMTDLISLSQNGFKSNKNWIHLTFDDGYRNNYSLLYPYLKQKQIPFSLFVSTNHIEKNERMYTYKIRCAILNTKKEVHLPGLDQSLAADASRRERIKFGKRVAFEFKAMDKARAGDLMKCIEALLSDEEWRYYNNLYQEDELLTLDQLKELAGDALVHIGSHNHNHFVLNRNVREDDIYYEMCTSKAWLQEKLNINPLTYCYPNGSRRDLTPNSKRICQNLGYELAFTTIKQPVYPNTDKYEIPRFDLPTDDSNIGRYLMRLVLPSYFAFLIA